MQTRNSQESVSDNGCQPSEYEEFCKSHDHVVTYLLKILEDCFNMNPLYGRTDYLRDKETLSRRFYHEGLSFATKTLPSFFDNLLIYLETGNSAYPSFKMKPGRQYPTFLWRLVKPIYDDHTSASAVMCMKHLYQLCVAFKKLKGPYKQSVLIEQLDEFVKTDQELDSNWSDDEIVVLEKARHLIHQVLKGLNPFDVSQSEKFIPRPGPGATNSPTKKHERYRPHVYYTQLSEFFDQSEWHTSDNLNYKGHKGTLIGSVADKQNAEKENLLTSRFKFVHKTFGKPRCICIEQLEMQWLQQGLRRALYDRIETHPLTRGYVSFTDQSVNGLIAQRTSCHGIRDFKSFATIDMSSASDRVSRKLVEYLFQDNDELLQALLCLSTRIIELPRDIPYTRKWLFTKKYAPMGSALCFPVMGLVHFALVKSIISLDSPQHINDISAWVYGDDIIVHTAYADKVFEWLPKFGMKLNRSKSFTRSIFRESCGVHAYNGVVITPVRFKSIVRNPLSVNDLVSALENESMFHSKGYINTAKFIRDELLKAKGVNAKAFPTIGRKSPVLGWIRDDKDAALLKPYKGLKRRWSDDWQRYMYRTRVITSLCDDSPPICDDEYYLRKQVENPLETRKIDGLPLGLSIRWQWLPDSAFFHA